MNKQSIKLLKEAVYYIKKAEFEKQSALKGKSMSKAWEAGVKGVKSLGEGVKKGWNWLWGSGKPVEAPQTVRPQTPKTTTAKTNGSPKRVKAEVPPEWRGSDMFPDQFIPGLDKNRLRRAMIFYRRYTDPAMREDALSDLLSRIPQDASFHQLSQQDQKAHFMNYGLPLSVLSNATEVTSYNRPDHFYNDLLDFQKYLNRAYRRIPESSYFKSPEAPNYPGVIENLPKDAMNLRLQNLQNRYENMALQQFLGKTGNTEAQRRGAVKMQNATAREIEDYLDYLGRRGPQGEILYNIENKPNPNEVNFFNIYDGLLRPEER